MGMPALASAPAPAPAPTPTPTPALRPHLPAGGTTSISLEYRELLLSRVINAIFRASQATAMTLHNYRLLAQARDVFS